MPGPFSGPIPKRSEGRRRRNKDGAEILVVDLDMEIAGTIEIPAPPLKYVDKDGNELPEPKPLWHPTVEQAYLSLSASGQSIFFEPSDWATAYLLCDAFSRELQPKPMLTTDSEGATTIEWVLQPVNGSALTAFLKGWASLMTTEGERRRLRVELDRKRHRDGLVEGNTDVVPISKKRNQRFAASQEA